MAVVGRSRWVHPLGSSILFSLCRFSVAVLAVIMRTGPTMDHNYAIRRGYTVPTDPPAEARRRLVDRTKEIAVERGEVGFSVSGVVPAWFIDRTPSQFTVIHGAQQFCESGILISFVALESVAKVP